MCWRFHLQVLFLSGKRVREMLNVLCPILLDVRVQRIRHFINERIDFFHEASTLLHLVYLEDNFKMLSAHHGFSDRTVFRNCHFAQIMKIYRSNEVIGHLCKMQESFLTSSSSYFFCRHLQLHELGFSTKNMPRCMNLHKAHTGGLSLR